MSGELSGGMNGSIKKSAPMVFTTADIVTAFGMLVCGFLYWNLINVVSLGLGVTLFTAVLCIVVIAYFRNAGLRQSKESLTLLGIIILSAASFALFDGILIKALHFIFLSLAFVYWVCLSAGTRLGNKISLYILSDMLHQLVVIPFGNFTGCFTGLKQVFVKNKKGKNVLGGVIGILFFLPVLILVVTLLANADAAFEGLMGRIRFSISENVLEHIRNIILGLPVACYLYGLIYGNRYKRHVGNATVESVNEHVKAFRFAPDVTVYSALTALNLIYVVFFLAQTSYFFSAFGDSLPQAMTYAEYARRGFFELCAVSGINLAVIAVAHLIVKRDKVKILHGETATLCIFTLALIVTAMSKMGMYISYYGLTRLRVYTSWFMIVLLFLFVIVLFRQFKGFQGTRIAVVGCICLFIALAYGNVDGMIAKYNIDRYRAGTMETLDLSAISDLSDGAIPYLYELYRETDNPKMKEELKRIITRPPYNELEDYDGFRDFNMQRYKADQIRNIL